jgi:hypothetical protein
VDQDVIATLQKKYECRLLWYVTEVIEEGGEILENLMKTCKRQPRHERIRAKNAVNITVKVTWRRIKSN